MPRLYHPDLDVTIDVDESKARNRRKSGWVDVDEPDVEAESVEEARPSEASEPDGDAE